MSTFFLDKQEKFWDDVYKSEVNIKVLNNKYQITDCQVRGSFDIYKNKSLNEKSYFN